MSQSYTTDADVRDLVTEMLAAGDHAEDFDVDAIVADVVQAAEYDGTAYDLSGVDVWQVIAQHDTSGGVAG